MTSDVGGVEVSVVVPTKNAAHWLPEQLESLAAQEDPPHFEVVIADNGSTDDLREVVGSYRDLLEIVAVDASQHTGASWARNVGAKTARGEVLVFCDADDIVDLSWVRTLSRAVSQGSSVLAVGALRHGRYNSPAVLAAYDIPPDREPSHEVGAIASKFAGYLPTVAGNNFAVRRSDYLALGGMDRSYPGGSEETDFAWRAQEAGLRVVTVPEAVVHYRLRGEPGTIFRQQRIQQRARMLLWRRYGHKGMAGPSWKTSILTAVREGVALAIARTPQERLTHARVLGGHVGALEGMVRYRLLRQAPPVLLGSDDADPKV